MTHHGNTFVSFGEIIDMGDLEFLSNLEITGDLIKELSVEFTNNATQITVTPASGKTFFHVRSKLYPVVDTIKTGIAANNTVVTSNRRADVEITNESTVVDILTHDMESTQGSGSVTNVPQGQGNAAATGQYTTNIMDSLIGDGIKTFTAVSTNTSGTYRVSIFGWIQNT